MILLYIILTVAVFLQQEYHIVYGEKIADLETSWLYISDLLTQYPIDKDEIIGEYHELVVRVYTAYKDGMIQPDLETERKCVFDLKCLVYKVVRRGYCDDDDNEVLLPSILEWETSYQIIQRSKNSFDRGIDDFIKTHKPGFQGSRRQPSRPRSSVINGSRSRLTENYGPTRRQEIQIEHSSYPSINDEIERRRDQEFNQNENYERKPRKRIENVDTERTYPDRYNDQSDYISSEERRRENPQDGYASRHHRYPPKRENSEDFSTNNLRYQDSNVHYKGYDKSVSQENTGLKRFIFGP